MLCVVVYLYASSLTLWALNVTAFFKNVHALFIDYPDMPLEDRGVQANINVLPLATPEEALFMLNVRPSPNHSMCATLNMPFIQMVVGDSVVIWRAWVLYQRTLWVVSIPCIMLLMSLSESMQRLDAGEKSDTLFLSLHHHRYHLLDRCRL